MERIAETVNQVLDSIKSATSTRTCRSCGQQFEPEASLDAITGKYGPDWHLKISNWMSIRIQSCPACIIPAYEKLVAEYEASTRKERTAAVERHIAETIPAIFRGATLDDFSPEIKKQVAAFLKSGTTLFISGKCGTGKTHLGCAMLIGHMRASLEKYTYVNTTDLILKIKASFSDNQESEEKQIDAVSSGKMFFDDVGSFKMSEFAAEVLYTVMDRRYRDAVQTVYSSNLSLAEISENLGDRIASRLSSGMVLELTGFDKRLMAGHEFKVPMGAASERDA